jgi:hypothetical protein
MEVILKKILFSFLTALTLTGVAMASGRSLWVMMIQAKSKFKISQKNNFRGDIA